MSVNAPAVITAAIAHELKAGKLPPGVHHVDTTITFKVTGTVKKNEDEPYTPTAEIPLLPTMALLLEKAGIVGDAAINMLATAMKEALILNEKPEDAIKSKLKDYYAAEKKVLAMIGDLPEKKRSGKTIYAVSVEEVKATGFQQVG
jgi:xanthine/CO dehydrogenase XdhC/CoxF family maturation factor